jgi:hypothetical protein
MQKTTTLKGSTVFWLKSFLATLVLILVFQSSFAQKQAAAAAAKSTPATHAAKKQTVDPSIIAASKEKERQKLAAQNSTPAATSGAFSDAVKDEAAVKVQTNAVRAKQKGVTPPAAAPAKVSTVNGAKTSPLRAAAAKARGN